MNSFHDQIRSHVSSVEELKDVCRTDEMMDCLFRNDNSVTRLLYWNPDYWSGTVYAIYKFEHWFFSLREHYGTCSYCDGWMNTKNNDERQKHIDSIISNIKPTTRAWEVQLPPSLHFSFLQKELQAMINDFMDTQGCSSEFKEVIAKDDHVMIEQQNKQQNETRRYNKFILSWDTEKLFRGSYTVFMNDLRERNFDQSQLDQIETVFTDNFNETETKSESDSENTYTSHLPDNISCSEEERERQRKEEEERIDLACKQMSTNLKELSNSREQMLKDIWK